MGLKGRVRVAQPSSEFLTDDQGVLADALLPFGQPCPPPALGRPSGLTQFDMDETHPPNNRRSIRKRTLRSATTGVCLTLGSYSTVGTYLRVADTLFPLETLAVPCPIKVGI